MGIDSQRENGEYVVYQYTGSAEHTRSSRRRPLEWVEEVQALGAGEIVLNCMSSDGVGQGYDVEQLSAVRARVSVPLVASGGAGRVEHFLEVFEKARVDAALAAGVFHRREIAIAALKAALGRAGLEVRT